MNKPCLAIENQNGNTSLVHLWRIEPVSNVDPALAKRSPWYTLQHAFYRRDTNDLVGIIRRLKGEFKTAWFSGNGVTVKRHYTLQSAKKFLERQFTRTVPSSSLRNTQHAPRFNILPYPALTPRQCPNSNRGGAQIIHVNFCRSPKSKIQIQKSKIISSPSVSHTPPNASPNQH